jgi:hypothetical protein
MEVHLAYDTEIDAWTLSHKDVHIETSADVAEWRRLMHLELAKLHGKRGYLLISIAGFEVSAVMMEEYGRTAQAVARHFLGVIRYGASAKTERAVVLQSILNRFPANLFPDRGMAIKALERIRALPARTRT